MRISLFVVLLSFASECLPQEAKEADGPHYSVNGEWGNVLGTREALPLELAAWGEEGGLGSVKTFLERAVNERWGGCRDCTHAARLSLETLLEATRQVVTFTKDGTTPLHMTFRRWNGETTTEALLLGVVYNVSLVVRAEDVAHAANDANTAEAYATTHHDMVLYGDREGLFSVVQHTWVYPKEEQAEGGATGLLHPELFGRARIAKGAEGAEAAAAPLGLVCYNIWNFNHPWPRRLDLITKAIAERVPDIIAFQEVRYDNGGAQLGPEATRHQVDHLLWRLEHMGVWQVVWVPAMSYLQDDKGLAIQTEGPSIFTRLPVKHVDALQLTRFYPEDKGDEHQRVCLAVTIETPQLGAINVLTTHLTLSETARMNNVYEICKYAKSLESDPKRGKVTILTGDLNMIPSDGAMQYLLGEVEYKGTRCDFQDVWLSKGTPLVHELGDLEHGFTFNNLNQKLEKRIDFVLVRGAVDTVSFDLMEVFGSRINVKPDNVPPSDHMGLYTALSSAAGKAKEGTCSADDSCAAE